MNPYGITTTSFTLAFVASKRARLPIPPRVHCFLYYNTRHCENGLSDSRMSMIPGGGERCWLVKALKPWFRIESTLAGAPAPYSILRPCLRDGLPSHVLRRISAAAFEGHDVVRHVSGARARRLPSRGTRMLALEIAAGGGIPFDLARRAWYSACNSDARVPRASFFVDGSQAISL